MIEVLPPNIANQIAAGEVIQRPASIVKELMENAVDAGAGRVIVRVVDGGRTLIGVIDDGMGMEHDDAQRAFLRHATSKIRQAEDLFDLHTFGFRGEALASIASVAQVEMRTRRAADQIGTLIEISSGTITKNETIDTPKGTSITVRNLFFNIPARRKFLKSDRAEALAVHTEFVRVAMVNPDIAFELHNSLTDKPLLMASGGLHQRIIDLTKASLKKKLLSVDLNTDLIRLSGYVGTPDTATIKSGSAQFLFVNGRFVRSQFLARALVQAYDRLISSGSYPSYFLFLELSPASIDVNISPTKTEVKFDDEQAIFHTIYAAVKGCLGRSNVLEAIDFEGGASPIDIPTYAPLSSDKRTYSMPLTHSNRAYNPFLSYDTSAFQGDVIDVEKVPFMEILPDDMNGNIQNTVPKVVTNLWKSFQLDDKYLVVGSGDGISIINIARARCRIEYERIVKSSGSLVAQYLITPEKLDLDIEQRTTIIENQQALEDMGFVVVVDDNSVEVHALPSGFKISDFTDLLPSLADRRSTSVIECLAERLSRGMLNEKCGQMADVSAFVVQLMACTEPSYTPSGLKIIEIVERDEIEKRMK
ncbi:MAG: DNA mismatch repair endonuclease MutL [Mucinivorans sp.]